MCAPHQASRLLAPFDLPTLDADAVSICGVGAGLRIIYVNQAWRDFGRENGSTWEMDPWPDNVALLGAIAPTLRPFYEGLFEEARATRAPVDHSYECSSPRLYRRFLMRISPCESGSFVVSHSLSLQAPHDRRELPAIDALYLDASGIISQCCHCRRVRRPDQRAQWDWVPAYAGSVGRKVSHGLCPLCLAFYYPE